jgi:hypothetical protein
MYWSSADFSRRFRLNGKSRKTFNIIVSTKYAFFYFNLEGLQPGSPPWMRPCFGGILSDSLTWPHGTPENKTCVDQISEQRRHHVPSASALIERNFS